MSNLADDAIDSTINRTENCAENRLHFADDASQSNQFAQPNALQRAPTDRYSLPPHTPTLQTSRALNPNAVLPPLYYRLLIWIAKPLYRLYLATKSDKLPFYEQEIAERFGTDYRRPTPKMRAGAHQVGAITHAIDSTIGSVASHTKLAKVIWCHAVSLGELNTVAPLLRLLLADGHALYLTSTTQTGFRRAAELFALEIEAGQVVQGFVPADSLPVVYRFLVNVAPDLALFVETELWANTLYLLNRFDVPSVLINARLVDKSRVAYEKYPALARSMMANLTRALAQDARSLANLHALGLAQDRGCVLPSLKWAQQATAGRVLNPQISPVDRFDARQKSPIWIAASTHDGEETAALAAHKTLLQTYPNALLIIVPRHPERFDAVWTLIDLPKARRSAGNNKRSVLDKKVQVYLVDTMGELLGFYALAAVAFVGGSLVNKGGHNPIEPIALGVPVVMGQYTQACAPLLPPLIDVGALVQIASADNLAAAVLALLDDKAAGARGQAVARKNANAAVLQYDALQAFLV